LKERRFRKIKVNSDDKIVLNYDEENKNGDWDEYSMVCGEKALPEFYEAMKNLSSFVLDMCELPKGDSSKIRVKGVSFSYGGDNDTMGATITASKLLTHSNTDLNLNTPHKIEEFYSENGDENQLMPDGCAYALEELIKQAERFLDGEREQLDIFSEDAEKEEVPEEKESEPVEA